MAPRKKVTPVEVSPGTEAVSTADGVAAKPKRRSPATTTAGKGRKAGPLAADGEAPASPLTMPDTVATLAEAAPLGLEESIQTEAYLIWLDEGQPSGRAQAHWLQAQQRVMIRQAGVNSGESHLKKACSTER
jgi:hypothetical protein